MKTLVMCPVGVLITPIITGSHLRRSKTVKSPRVVLSFEEETDKWNSFEVICLRRTYEFRGTLDGLESRNLYLLGGTKWSVTSIRILFSDSSCVLPFPLSPYLFFLSLFFCRIIHISYPKFFCICFEV